MILSPVMESAPREGSRGGRSRSRTPTGSLAFGSTTSPTAGYPDTLGPCSPMQISPPHMPNFANMGAVHYLLCSPQMDMPANIFDGRSAPASPLIPWTELSPTALEGQVFDDSWSANILPADDLMQQPQSYTYNTPSPAKDQTGLTAQQMMEVNVWAGLFGERSGSHDPNPAAIQAWNGAWLDGPTAGPYEELQPLYAPQVSELSKEARLFGP